MDCKGKKGVSIGNGGVAVWGPTWFPCADNHGCQGIYDLLAINGSGEVVEWNAQTKLTTKNGVSMPIKVLCISHAEPNVFAMLYTV